MPARAAVTERFFRNRYLPLDGIVFGYTAWVALLVAVLHQHVPRAGWIVATHLLVLAFIAVLPPRGAAWERSAENEPAFRRHVRGGLRFLRDTYPLLLVIGFFEEVQYTVNAVRPGTPYWFEPHLYAADRFLLGELPAVLLNPFVGLVQDEIMHAFYFSYYFIVVSAVVIAWFGPRGSGHPGPRFHTTVTAIVVSFVLCFVWYPFLPARGPWENPELMASLTPFRGFLFTPIIQAILEQGAVSGGCYPSSHVAGSWGAVFGLAGFHPRSARILAFFATGMSFACVYTRYHHGVDVPAGFLAGVAGGIVARILTRTVTPRPATA